MKHINISFLGLGVVGTKLMEYVQNSRAELHKSTGSRFDIKIDKIYVRDINKKRRIDTSELVLSDDPIETVKNADIVIDCMGGDGVEITRRLILGAMQQNKAVIMSSKKCLALYGKEICRSAEKNNAILRYDATVGGCIPISRVFEEVGHCEKINRIYGICNATSNYILDEMQQKGITYGAALIDAKNRGYAENDPTEDIDGWDALYKAVIMAGFGMHQWLDCEAIQPVSVRNVTQQEFAEAKQNKCIVKPMISIEKDGEHCSCMIGPVHVSTESLLAFVKGNNNMIIVEGSESGERAYYGQGAGAKPTASAMFDDLTKTINDLVCMKH